MGDFEKCMDPNRTQIVQKPLQDLYFVEGFWAQKPTLGVPSDQVERKRKRKRKRERERERDRQTETDRDRQRQTRDRETERQRERERETERQGAS